MNTPVAAHTPAELTEQMAYHMALEDLKDSVDQGQPWATVDLARVLSERMDPGYILRELIDDVPEFLSIMLVTNSFLGGSRAASYFYPYIKRDSDEWIIYCDGNAIQQRMVYEYFCENGFVLESGAFSTSIRAGSLYAQAPPECIIGYISKGDTFNLVTIVRTGNSNNIHTAIQMTNTVDQCLITGYGAISLQSHISRAAKVALWPPLVSGGHSTGATVTTPDSRSHPLCIWTQCRVW